jgi:hypothetical protein
MVHTFSDSGITKQSYTFFLDRSIGVMGYNLGVVKKLGLKCSTDGMIEAEADVLFKGEATGSIGTPAFPTQKYLGFQSVTFEVAGSTNTNVKEWDLNLDNGAKRHAVFSQSQEASEFVCAERFNVEGGFTIYFDSLTERNKFLANTAVALRILCEGEVISGAIKHTIDINIYEAHYKAFPYGEDSGLLAAKASFDGFYSVGDSKQIDVAVTNEILSY